MPDAPASYAARSVTPFASAARTESANSADQNTSAQRAQIIIDVTSVTSTPSVVFTVQGKDEVSGKYYDLLVSQAITATGTTVLHIGAPVGQPNAATAAFLPSVWRVKAVHADSDSITYSVAAVLAE